MYACLTAGSSGIVQTVTFSFVKTLCPCFVPPLGSSPFPLSPLSPLSPIFFMSASTDSGMVMSMSVSWMNVGSLSGMVSGLLVPADLISMSMRLSVWGASSMPTNRAPSVEILFSGWSIAMM